MANFSYTWIVRSLMYAMICIRPYIVLVVDYVSYVIKGTSKVLLCFRQKQVILKGYTDLDLGGCSDSRRITTGCVFIVGGSTLIWMSKLGVFKWMDWIYPIHIRNSIGFRFQKYESSLSKLIQKLNKTIQITIWKDGII